MKESVAIAKVVDAKKESSPTRSDKNIQGLQNEPDRQLGSLRGVIGNIKRDGGTPSAESIAMQLSGMRAGERAPVLLALQQTHGNRYVQRVVTGIQAKLVVGQPGDKYEQEADRVADQVMLMPEPNVQRQIEKEEEEDLIKTKPLAEWIRLSVQGQVEEEEELQAKEISGQTPDLEARINAIRGGGQPLPASTRTFFEPRFGADFGQVRLHTGAQAAESARVANAKAFTTGKDVVFGAGQYSPETSSGKRLLAHELTHVVQQDKVTSNNKTDLYHQSLKLKRQEIKNIGILREIAAQGIACPSSGIPRKYEMERAFEADFSNVKAHIGSKVQKATKSLGAKAYTVGQDIVFHSSSPDCKTVAHELTHIRQQDTSASTNSRGVTSDADPMELEALNVANAVIREGQAPAISMRLSPETIARDQQLGEARQSRIAVATSVQSFRTGSGRDGRGRLAIQLLQRLRTARNTVEDAVTALGQGRRLFRSRPQSGEEPTGVAVGASSGVGNVIRRAVVVANADYDENATMGDTAESLRGRDMPGAITDANEIRAALRQRSYRFHPGDTNNQTAIQIESLLVTALNGGHGFNPPLAAGSELVFFFRGHGIVQGLVGVDGTIFSPAMMLSIRNQAYRRGVAFIVVLNACHSGAFTDAIRSAELLSTRQAALVRVGRPGPNAAALTQLATLLDNAIAVQRAKNGFTQAMREWWNRWYELSAPYQSQAARSAALAQGRTDAEMLAEIHAHDDNLTSAWNGFVRRVEPLLATLYVTAGTAGVTLPGRLRLQTYSGSIVDYDRVLQAQLDDIDTILNTVLEHVDTSLR